jgi:hypothetical protein
MTSPSTLVRSLLFGLVTLALPCVTHAADPTPEEIAKEIATQRLKEGVDIANDGDCATAIAKFQESDATYRSDGRGALFNIALCERQLGRTGASYLHFLEFRHGLKREDSTAIANDEIAANAIAAMMKVGPWIRFLNLDKLPANATTLLDGLSLSPSEPTTDIPVKVGDHIVVIKVPGHPERRLPVYVHAGERHEVDVRPPDRPLRRVGFIIGGVGLGSLIAGTVTGILAKYENTKLVEDCGDPKSCRLPTEQLEPRKVYGKNVTIASDATFIVGSALTAIGATLIFLPPSKSKEVALSPLVLPGGGGLSATARF